MNPAHLLYGRWFRKEILYGIFHVTNIYPAPHRKKPFCGFGMERSGVVLREFRMGPK
uniref:Uncharacterized protein n=1 Tax=uncultured organism TaxID=155900 RepID=Q1ZZJ5_9ZZZZ|nr:unknown [uncultured organism]